LYFKYLAPLVKGEQIRYKLRRINGWSGLH
jgi:hypothetical protein